MQAQAKSAPRFTTVQTRAVGIAGHRVAELDGVRGVAILLVLAFHFGTLETTLASEKLVRVALGMSLGWSGVDLFFVLSGFLITSILLETKGSERYFPSFYARRVLRIFPLYLAAVFATFCVALPAAHALGWGREITFGDSAWYWAHLSNWRSALGRDVWPVTHFWSLAVEEQFYLVWPWVVLGLSERRLRRVCVGIVAGVLAARLWLAWRVDARILYRLTPLRMDGLAMGALVALVVRDRALAAWVRGRLWAFAAAGGAGLAAALALSRTPSSSSPWMSSAGFTSLAVLYASLVFYVVERAGGGSALARALRSRFLGAFGKYSYGLYVIHFPVSLAAVEGMRRVAEALGVRYHIGMAVVVTIIGTAVSLALAKASWRWIEEPCLRWKARFPYTH